MTRLQSIYNFIKYLYFLSIQILFVNNSLLKSDGYKSALTNLPQFQNAQLKDYLFQYYVLVQVVSKLSYHTLCIITKYSTFEPREINKTES